MYPNSAFSAIQKTKMRLSENKVFMPCTEMSEPIQIVAKYYLTPF